MATIPEMLTLRQAAAKTGLSYDYLRKLCLQKKIIFVKAGNKYLINMEKLADFLNGEDMTAGRKTLIHTERFTGRIRKAEGKEE